jgi:hypothetical protein
MTLITKDRVLETSTSTGTGDFALAGAVLGFRAFSAVCATNDTFYYHIEAIDTGGAPSGEWETGLGTYSAANTLTRTTVSDSSNAGAAVNFSAGTKRVAISAIATQIASMSRRLYSAYTNVGIAANTTEQTLQTYTLPGGTLAINGQAIRVTTRGLYANTSRSRQMRLYFGATVVTFMSSSTASAFNNAQEILLIRTGATTQIAFGPSENAGSSITSISSRFIEFNDPAETLANDIVIKVTGQSGVGAAANDVSCDLMLVEFLP